MSQKIYKGKVISTKMDKTLVVSVESAKKHKLYEKRYLSHKKYKVHCGDNEIKEGDEVTIRDCRPYSKDVKYEIVNIKDK